MEISVILLLLVVGLSTSTDPAAVWEDEPSTDSTVHEISSSSIKRILDGGAPLETITEERTDTNSSVPIEEPVDMVKLEKNSSAQNIQRVARKKLDSVMTDRVDLDYNATTADVEWLVRIFDLITWEPDGFPAMSKMKSHCSVLMKQYFQALRNGAPWASKMIDASGRYSSQFYFGNDFWLGSKTECMELQNKIYNPSVPPFTVHFFVSKFMLKMENHETSYNRLMTIGLCLPEDCDVSDIKMMLQEDAANAKSDFPARSVAVIGVRAVPGSYSLYADRKLHFLLIVLSVVLFLTAVGTSYEISLERKRKRRLRKHMPAISNNNDGDGKMANAELVENAGHSTHSSQDFRTNKDSVLSELVLSFSAVSNSRKILHVGSSEEESLTCIHGLRFLSLLWVIMVHTYLQAFTIAENKSLRTLAERNFMFQTVSNATFSVDTFFFISGLLVTYLYFKTARRESIEANGRRPRGPGLGLSILKFFKLAGYRFLRLTPAYMFVLLIAEISMRWIHNVSVFEPMSQNHVSCDKYWWRNLLFINSLYPMKDMCMLWSWYVSNDMQFYVLGIAILMFSLRYFKFAAGMLLFSLFTSWAVTIAISLYFDYRAKIAEPFLLFDELYDKPWTRLGPYLIGMFAGWFIFKTKCRLNVSKTTSLISWFLSFSTLFSLVYGLHIYPLGAVGSALYVSIGHTAWGVALAWMVIACCSGNGGFVDSILSFKLFHPLSRLTYCAYLIHPIIMTTTNFQMNAPIHLQDSLVMILYMGNVLASFVSSFCISLLFEAPVVRLLKIMFSSSPRATVKSQTSL